MVVVTLVVCSSEQNEVISMKHTVLAIGVLMYYFHAFLPSASAQAFGEYGRTLGGATQRQVAQFPNRLAGAMLKEQPRVDSKASAIWVCSLFKTGL